MKITNRFSSFVGTLLVTAFFITTLAPLTFAATARFNREQKVELQRSLRAQEVRYAQELGKEFRRIGKENDQKQEELKKDFDQKIEKASEVSEKRSLMAEYTRQNYALRAELANKRAEAQHRSEDALVLDKQNIYQSYGLATK